MVRGKARRVTLCRDHSSTDVTEHIPPLIFINSKLTIRIHSSKTGDVRRKTLSGKA